MEELTKFIPQRKTTRRVTYINLLFSWGAIYLAIILGVPPDIANTIIRWGFASNTILLLIYTSRSFADKLAEKVVDKLP